MTEELTCAICKRVIEGDCARPNRMLGSFKLERVTVHPTCLADYRVKQEHEKRLWEAGAGDRAERALAEEKARETRQRVKSFRASFGKSLVGNAMTKGARVDDLCFWEVDGVEDDQYRFKGPLKFPNWEWARFSNEEFRRRVSPTILRALEAWSPDRDGSIVITGPTGRGKSSCPVAWVWREHDRMLERVEAGENLGFSFAWITGYELSGARKRSPLGEESRLVQHAMDVPLLFLDEVGTEPACEELFAVLDARYRGQLVTVLTSPLEPKALATTIGGGAYRRLLERGALIDVHQEKGRVRSVS
jgi:hypothetical protein